MATINLIADTNFDALSPAPTLNDDIALGNYKLTLNVINPAAKSISTAGTGTLAWSSASATYTFTGHSSNSGRTIIQAGTGALWTDASNVTRTIVNSAMTAGTAGSAYVVDACYSNFSNCIGNAGTNSSAYFANTLYGRFVGGILLPATAHAININSGELNTTTLAAGNTAKCPVNSNYGLISLCPIIGGSVTNANGVNFNRAVIQNCPITGGSNSGASGIGNNNGVISNLESGIISDSTGRAIGAATQYGAKSLLLIIGANLQCLVPASVGTIYYTGQISPSASYAGSPTMIPLISAGFLRKMMGEV